MNAVDIAALAASIAAGTLAVVAIGLSIAFFRMSARVAENIQQADQHLSGSIARLEKLFDTLYREALTILRENHGEPPSGPTAPAAVTGGLARASGADVDRKLEAVKREILDGLSALLARATAEHRDPGAMSAEMTEVIDRAIAQSRGRG